MTRSLNDADVAVQNAEAPHAELAINAIDDRRALLKKLGRFGLYTAPALLISFESAKAAAIPSNSL